MPWYSSQTIEIIYWKWETKILNSFVGRSCLLHITLVLELHICKSLRYSSFLGGWSHTQRKFVNLPCTGKTCAWHVGSFPLNITSESFSTLSETYLPSLANYFILLCAAYTRCQIQNSGASSSEPHLWNKLTLEDIHWVVWFSLLIFESMYLWTTEGHSCWQLFLLY